MDSKSTTEDKLASLGPITPGSKEEMLYHLITSFNNDYFGWKQDDLGYYKDLFLIKSHAKFLRQHYSLKKLSSTPENLYRIRPTQN